MAVNAAIQRTLDTAEASGDITATENKFLGGLGVTAAQLTGLGGGLTVAGLVITPAMTIQEVIGAHSKADLFKAFEAVDPAASTLTSFLDTEPVMGDALYEAIVNNPNVLPTITRLADSGRLSEIGDYLASADPSSPLAGIAKQRTIDELRKLARDPARDTAAFEGLLNMTDGLDFGALLSFVQNIMNGMPLKMAANNLITDFGLTGAEAESVRYFAEGPLGQMFEGIMGGTTGYGGIYHEDSAFRQGLDEVWNQAINLPGISGAIGGTVGYQTDVAATVTYDPVAFSTAFDAAASSIDFSDGIQPNEILASLDYTATIEPSSAAEMAAIKHLATTDPAVQAQFSSYSGMTKADLARSWDQLMKDLSRPDPSTGATATPREAAMSFS